MSKLTPDVLDHPCKDTCSGWKQGFEKGVGLLQGAGSIDDKRIEEVAKKYADINANGSEYDCVNDFSAGARWTSASMARVVSDLEDKIYHHSRAVSEAEYVLKNESDKLKIAVEAFNRILVNCEHGGHPKSTKRIEELAKLALTEIQKLREEDKE